VQVSAFSPKQNCGRSGNRCLQILMAHCDGLSLSTDILLGPSAGITYFSPDCFTEQMTSLQV